MDTEIDYVIIDTGRELPCALFLIVPLISFNDGGK
ncbi:hypothetical protein T07_171 [Trichinella nelsoni]|uniref:Uncharacterized protein n=1 Tax=Trichinella nelsoni TaxID=6336 RepID=A0A0V0RCV7_9BILA|nr:hypothetical protein T07_171 [Trichinella nelsoni]